MSQFCNQPAGPQQQDYAERSAPFGCARRASEQRCGINQQSALWPLCRYRHKTHWTGAKHRLDRDYSKRFGDEAYAREELVAEMGSAFLCATLGIVPTVRHADYIGSWLTVLKNDSRAIVSAASHASKAADLLLAFVAPAAAAQDEAEAA
jgi:antirestriction protein ArdC